MLMIGVTLATGGLVASAALGQLGLANASASTGAAIQGYSSGVQLALVYVATTPSGSCPVYDGFHEGTTLTISLYDYGTSSFTPEAVALNGSVYPGPYAPLANWTIGSFAVTIGSCAHPSGQTILAIDPQGDEVQFAS